MRNRIWLERVICVAVIYLAGAGVTMSQVPQLLNYQGRIAVNGTNFSGTGLFGFALVDGGSNQTQTATGTATVDHGFLVAVTVTRGGSGYTAAPTVSATGGGGSGASFTVQFSGGVVTNVIVNSAGSGYTNPPTISFSSPPTNLVAQTYWSNDGTSSSGGQPVASVPLTVTKGLYSVLLGDTTLPNMTALSARLFTNPVVLLRVWFSDGTNGFQQLAPDERLAAVGYAIMAGSVPSGSITGDQIAAGAVGSSQLSSNLTIPGTMTVGNLVVNGSATTGTTNYLIPSGTNIQAYAGGTYFITNTSANVILPSIVNAGDVIRLITPNANGGVFTIEQNPGQRIVNWTSVNPGPPVLSSADGNQLLVNAGQAFFLSTNSADNWTCLPPLEPWPTPNSYSGIQISADGSHIYVGAYFNNVGGILISRDNGNSWILNTNIALHGNQISAIACSTNGVEVVAVVQNLGLFTSTDAGSNWIFQTSAPTFVYGGFIACSADGTKLAACVSSLFEDSGIFTSGNSGQTWQLQTSAPTNAVWTSIASSADGTKLVATAQYNGASLPSGIYTSGNSGTNWTLQSSAPVSASWRTIASSADGTKLAAGSTGNSAAVVYTSADSGTTWTPQTTGLPSTSCYSVASSADGLELAAFVGNCLYKSVNSGNTWTLCSNLQSQESILIGITSLGTEGGATFAYQLTLVYLGGGMFALSENSYLNGY